MTDTIPLDDVARQLGNQLLQILSLQQRIAAQQQVIAAREKRLGEIEAECDRLRMALERTESSKRPELPMSPHKE